MNRQGHFYRGLVGKSQQLLIEVDPCSGGVFGVLGKRFKNVM